MFYIFDRLAAGFDLEIRKIKQRKNPKASALNGRIYVRWEHSFVCN